MKFYEIALMMFVIHITGVYLAANAGEFNMTGVFDINTITLSDIKAAEDLKIKVALNETAVSSSNPLSIAFGAFYEQVNRAVYYLFNQFPLVKYVAWIPFYLRSIGIPVDLANLIFLIYSIIEGIGFFQLITGRLVE